MKVLIVANHNKGYFAPFVTEQADALKKRGVEIDYFGIVGKGIPGYLRNRKRYIRKIKSFKPDLIHAHYGLSGLLANLQCKIPVVTTYHGTDINNDKVFRFSKISIKLSAFNIFVSEKNKLKAKQTTRQAVIPCGVDIALFKRQEKGIARERLGFSENEKIILFAGAFENKVKNARLAHQAVSLMGNNIRLIELKGYSRNEVALLMSAADTLLMTSFTEGSPQVVKEALSSDCPVVSVDVGDVGEILNEIPGCFICRYDPEDIAGKLKEVFNITNVKGRSHIMRLGLDSDNIANKILHIYQQIIKK
jgi:glycosyltransferase involved in cell wall biosynthesis